MTPRPDTGGVPGRAFAHAVEKACLGRTGLDEWLTAHRQAPVLGPAIGGKEFHGPSPALAAFASLPFGGVLADAPWAFAT